MVTGVVTSHKKRPKQKDSSYQFPDFDHLSFFRNPYPMGGEIFMIYLFFFTAIWGFLMGDRVWVSPCPPTLPSCAPEG